MIEIRTERKSDRATVQQIIEDAFGSRLQAGIVNELRDSADPQVSLVAVVNSELVGHIFFSPVYFDSVSAPAAAQLSPVAVKTSTQRQGIGTTLIRNGLERCRDVGWAAVFLVGSPAYYARFGFSMAREIDLHCGGENDPYLQYLELLPGSLTGIRGRVSFHPAFLNPH